MLPINLQNKIALGCYAIVSNMFASFLNPRYRGSNFKWENFPEMMKEHCERHVFLNTEIPKKHEKLAKEHAMKTGFQIAENLVKKMQE